MKKRSYRVIIIASFVFVLLSAQLVSAASQYLAWRSKYTYVQNEHNSGLDFTYRGNLSIRGLERYGSQGNDYPGYVRITYTLNGKDTRYYLYSHGEMDAVVRTRTVVFRDSLNPFAPKTKASGHIGMYRAKLAAQSIDPSTER